MRYGIRTVAIVCCATVMGGLTFWVQSGCSGRSGNEVAKAQSGPGATLPPVKENTEENAKENRAESGPAKESPTDTAEGNQASRNVVEEGTERPVDLKVKQQVDPEPDPEESGSTEPDDISFDNIKFDMEIDDEFEMSMLTKEIHELKGKRIRIRGYMLPSFQQTGITEFVLVRDNMECCFGPGAMIFDCIIVKMDPGETAEFDVKPIAVEGVFQLEPVEIDGELLALYALKANSAK